MSSPVTSSGRSDDASAKGSNNSAGRRLANRSRPRTQAEQPLLRALIHGQTIPLRAAHGTEQHGIGVAGLGQRLGRQRRPVAVDGDAAEVGAVEGERQIESFEHADGMRHDLGADAVAGQHQYAMGHGWELLVVRIP